MVVNPKLKTRKLASLPPEMWRRIAEYQQRKEIGSEAEALRRLVEAGLQAEAKSKRRP